MPNPNAIQTIKDYFDRHNGLQLSNRFIVNFYNLPSQVWNSNSIEIQAEQVTLGPRSIFTIQDGLMGFGSGRFVPRSQNLLSGGYGAQIVFPVTNDNYILNFFNNWFNKFYPGPRSSTNGLRNAFVLPYYDDAVYNVVMEVQMLDPNGNPNNVTSFYEVFPIECQPLVLDMAASDKYLRYTVLFGFRDYYQNFNV